ncbi:MAG: segregation/condensation protein A [Oscillospiraceae bacterium]|nr:segregation/condensation protein A [Oscillospiraceae bacterium]
MDNPIFKLESVVQEHSEEALQDFEGPLDLILFLLSKNKIEIQNISVSLILDQYLAYLDERKRLDLDIASEFILMASHLMFIKSRMLVSVEDEEAKSEMEELINALQERRQKETYLRVKSMLGTMAALSEFGRNTMTRPPEPGDRSKVFDYHHKPEDLIAAMAAVSDRSERLAPPDRGAFSEIVRREPYSVTDKAGEIIARLKNFGITRFQLLFRGSRSRSEIVATFLAVLELCRAKAIRLVGSGVDCTVDWEKDAPENPVL